MSEYLVEAKTVQTGAIRTLVEALKCILVEMNFTFDKEGIKMVAMDNTRTVLVHMRLEASKFEKYSCTTPTVIGLNTFIFEHNIGGIPTHDLPWRLCADHGEI